MLIDKTHISAHRELSRSLKDDKINPFIEDAELIDLKKMLGSAFYFELEANKTDERFVNLLQPKTYLYNEQTFKHQGLEKVLSLLAYSRYVLHGSFTDTPFGLVEKTGQDSTPVSAANKKTTYIKDRQAAVSYFDEIAQYINRNKDTYPLYFSSCSGTSRLGFRISKIGKV